MIKRLFIVIVGLLLYFGPAYYAFATFTGDAQILGLFWLMLGWVLSLLVCIHLDKGSFD